MSDSPRDGHRSRRRRERQDGSSDSEEGHRRRRDSSQATKDVRSDRHESERHKRPDQDSHRQRREGRERAYRQRSRSRERSRHWSRSSSPPAKRRRRSFSTSRSPSPRAVSRRSRAPLPSQNESFRDTTDSANPDAPPVEKQKPNYKPTGLLAKEANTVAGTTTVLKYHEPPEARKPPAKEQWRMYVFKEKDLLDTIYLHRRSAWLLGRDEKVTDYLLEHPSVSKQHAVIQFRHSSTTNEFGDKTNKVKPYLIDLESANGTKLNGKKVSQSRFVELVDGDVVAFGDSEREYVLMLPPADAKT